MMQNLSELAKQYRKQLFEKFVEVGQGHPGSTFSIVEIVTTLYHAGFVRFDKTGGRFLDKVLISKGHATVALYPVLTQFGVIQRSDWDNWGKTSSCLRVFGNKSIPGIDVTSGSLGHGVGVGAGMALAFKRSNADRRVFVVISEGELYEGSTWEAMLFAAHHKLDNLSILIDINSLIILGNTDHCLALNPIKDKLAGFDFELVECDGHCTDSIAAALRIPAARTKVVLARTVKGKGFSLMENKAQWHYMNSLTPEQISQCRKEIA